MTTLVLFFVLGVVLSALYSGSETGVYAVNRLRLELRAESPADGAARTLARLMSSHEALLCVLLLGNNIANEATTILAERIVSELLPDAAFSTLITTVLLTPLLFLLGEALPKQLFRAHAESWAYRVAPFLGATRVVLAPLWLIVLPVARLANRWATGRKGSAYRHDEFALERLLSSAGQTVDPVREAALAIGTRHRAPVREVMIPVSACSTIDCGATRDTLRELLAERRHSRYPVRDADGIFRRYVYFLDAFANSGGPKRVEDVARPLAVLAPEAPIDLALAELEGADSRVAVVRDESGREQGFVFAADLVAGLLTAPDSRPREA